MNPDATYAASGSEVVAASDDVVTTADLATTAQFIDAMCRQHGDELYNTARRAGFAHDDAEDAVQDALIALWQYEMRHGGSKPAVEHPVAWLRKVAFRNAMRQKTRDISLNGLPLELAEIPAPSNGDDLESVVAASELLDVMKRKSPEAATYLQKLADGFTMAEIAEAAFTSPSEVRTKIHRLRRDLRHELLNNPPKIEELVDDSGKQDARRLLQALERLPQRQRQVLTLKLDSMETKAMATMLEISSGCVRVNLHHAKKKVAEMLKVPTREVLPLLQQIKEVTHRLAS
jgi:DNA-directed RNA polymerase specialized sigma24 family protein